MWNLALRGEPDYLVQDSIVLEHTVTATRTTIFVALPGSGFSAVFAVDAQNSPILLSIFVALGRSWRASRLSFARTITVWLTAES
jgi:hypothetical protein